MVIYKLSLNLPLIKKPTPEQLAGVKRSAATELAAAINEHFDGLPGQYFWKDAGKNTSVRVQGEEVAVVIDQPGVHIQWQGGEQVPSGRPSDVTGRPVKSLLIPCGDSPLQGRSSSGSRLNLGDLKLPPDQVKAVPGKSGETGRLIYIPATPKPKGGKRTKKAAMAPQNITLGFLVKRVTIPAHPEVMPSEGEMKKALAVGAHEAIRALRLK